MVDAAVESLIEYLHQVQIHQADLINDAKDLVDIDNLENDLLLFRAFLAETSDQRRRELEGVRWLLRQIRDVVYEVEDMINASLTQAADPHTKYYFLRAFQTPEKLRGIRRQLDSICAEIREIYSDATRFDFTSLSIREEEPKLSKVECFFFNRCVAIICRGIYDWNLTN